MFIVDNILMAPMKGLLWIFKEMHKAVEQDQKSAGESLTAELSRLYMQLETGQITEAEFDSREAEILEQLDAMESGGTAKE